MVLTGPRAPIRLTSYETLKWSALGSVNDSIVPVHFASILRWSHLSRFYCEIVPAVVLFSAGPVSYTHLDVYKRQVFGMVTP